MHLASWTRMVPSQFLKAAADLESRLVAAELRNESFDEAVERRVQEESEKPSGWDDVLQCMAAIFAILVLLYGVSLFLRHLPPFPGTCT